MLAGLLSESMFVKKHKQESFMTRAYCITLLAIVVLSSFAGAAQNSGKVWWPQFRGPDSTGIGEGNPPESHQHQRQRVLHANPARHHRYAGRDEQEADEDRDGKMSVVHVEVIFKRNCPTAANLPAQQPATNSGDPTAMRLGFLHGKAVETAQ